jgi:signal peptidase
VSGHGRHARHNRNPLRLLAGLWELRSTAVTALLAVGALALLVTAGLVLSLRVSAHTVLTGSMRGTFDPGAVVLTRQVPTASVRPGDVIVFVPPGESAPYTHRVLTVLGDPQHPVITTKGDANPMPDPWRARLTAPTVQKAFGSVPGVGRLLLAAHGSRVHTALLALFGTLVAVTGSRILLGPSRPRRATSLRTA